MEPKRQKVVDLFPVIKHFFEEKYKANDQLGIFQGKYEDTEIKELESGMLLLFNKSRQLKRKAQYKSTLDLVYQPFDKSAKFNFKELREEEIFFYIDFSKRDVILYEDI